MGPSAKTPFEAVYEWNYREDEPPQVRRLLNIKQVCSCLGLSRATVYRLIQAGKFPKPLHPAGTSSSRWTINDIEKYQEQSQRGVGLESVNMLRN
ncbi:MAG: AlpA family phage regulatory protein [SAR324 cluster bacterium]|nr:AlpA family phage regulatory protein [SAR324 cluster bacterium]